jgi:hypothetical protein
MYLRAMTSLRTFHNMLVVVAFLIERVRFEELEEGEENHV